MAANGQQANEELEQAVAKQGDTVRSLKAQAKEGKVEKAEVDAAVEKLKQLKAELTEKKKAFAASSGQAKSSASSKEAFREALSQTLTSKCFVMTSFKIYGGVAGFYDYGPPGCAIKQNVTQYWRQHFVLEENMFEVECPAVTPEVVLKASGHVDRFTDFMVADAQTGECHRADHLLEAHLEGLLESTANPMTAEQRDEVRNDLATVEELTAEQLGAALTKYGVKAPVTGNDLTAPYPFNLMFRTSIGPRGDLVGFLRPETAQGIFVNFGALLQYNNNKLPFAAAQIGQSYRNEIAPRAGLLRVREFTQAEIEHFCNPDDKSHPKFDSIAGVTPLLYSRELQMGAEKLPKPKSLGEAVAEGVIANQTLAYFIGRTYLFMTKVGIDPTRLRFRQHLQHEMAHYAEDCWDAEVECSYGWVECAGLADRSAYDLKAHSAKSKVALTAQEQFKEPRLVDTVKIAVNKQKLGQTFKRDAKAIQEALEQLSEEDALSLEAKLAAGRSAEVTVDGDPKPMSRDMVQIEKVQKKVSTRSFTPSVIEPSFGIGRILYCIFEHCYYAREGSDKRSVFAFPPIVAPVKATVFTLLAKPELTEVARPISAALTAVGLSNVLDTGSSTVGKRYARTDEIGVPFAVTVDYQTLEDDTVTIRERDSCAQIRVPVPKVPQVLRRLSDMTTTWKAVQSEYPAQQPTAEDAA